MKRIKPLFKYAGGKIRLLKTYTPFFQGLRPEHCIDYFGGSGSMSVWFHQLYPDAKLYLNDKDPAIYGLFKCIKEDYEEFCLDLNYLETWIHSRWTETDTIEKNIEEMKKWYYMFREEQYNVTQEIPDEWHYANFEKHPEDYDEPIALEKELGCSIKGLSKRQIENLLSLNDNGWSLKEWEEMSGQNTPFEHACYLIIRKLSYSGINQRNKKGEYTSAAGISRRNAPYTDLDTLTKFKAMLDHTELLNKNYQDIDIQLPRTLHYFDPPYVEASTNLYTSSFGWDETEELCDYLQRLTEHSTVFMSNYDHPRLKKLMKGFDWYSFPGVGRIQARKKEPVRETLFYKIHPSIVG